MKPSSQASQPGPIQTPPFTAASDMSNLGWCHRPFIIFYFLVVRSICNLGDAVLIEHARAGSRMCIIRSISPGCRGSMGGLSVFGRTLRSLPPLAGDVASSKSSPSQSSFLSQLRCISIPLDSAWWTILVRTCEVWIFSDKS